MRIPSNKINDVINFFKQELKTIYPAEEIKEFIFLSFNSILKFSRTDLSVIGAETMSESELLKFNNIVKDLKKHKPIQYILGSARFYGLNLLVNENVLIPRPETEELVDLIIKGLEAGRPKLEVNIIDIGTGSGCIAIALKKNIPNANVYAIDISEKALEVATQNAEHSHVEITFLKADILLSVNHQIIKSPNLFDIIVSNPPYITISEKNKMEKNVLHYEPHDALFVEDNDPLKFYRAIADFSLNSLSKNGKLFFEINEKYGQELMSMLTDKNFKNIALKKDISGKNRILVCTL